MCVTHKREDHDDVIAKRYCHGQHDTAANSGGVGGGNSNGNNLVVNKKLKGVLCSKLIINDAGVDNICNII